MLRTLGSVRFGKAALRRGNRSPMAGLGRPQREAQPGSCQCPAASDVGCEPRVPNAAPCLDDRNAINREL